MKARLRSLPKRRAAPGFTLLELLIAISLMAVLAVLGWRGLDSVLASRERISQASDEVRALSVSFTQMDEDLRRSWPVRLLNLPQPPVAFVADGANEQPALVLVRELPPGSGGSQLQRVSYRLRDGVFERGFLPLVSPAQGGGSGSTADGSGASTGATTEAQFTWQPLMSGVRGLQMRGWIAGQGWVPAAALTSRTGATALATGMVTGVEVSIEWRDGERVVRIFPVKD